MKVIKTKSLSASQLAQINELWNNEYPVKLKDRFLILLDGVTNFDHYFIENTPGKIMAWALTFEKENEIRFSIIVDEKHKGKGLGKLLVDKLKLCNFELYGWVIDHNNDTKLNGELYKTPLAFYEKNGFVILRDIRIDNQMLSAVKIKWKADYYE